MREGDVARFVALGKPTEEELRQLLAPIVRHAQRLLRPSREATQLDSRPADGLVAAQADSVSHLPWKRGAAAANPARDAAYQEGFSLHAGVHLHANDREGLAHLCGYGARPPLSQQRLSRLPDGRLVYRLKRPVGGAADMLVMEPRELLRKLAALVPPPRAHLVRYHGVFAPAAAMRQMVIPPAPEAPPSSAPAAPAPRKPKPDPSRIPWAELLRRVFLDDVLACPCGGRRAVLAFITQPKVVKEILEHLGLPTAGPPVLPARAASTGADLPWQDDVPVLQQAVR